ncbi:uncharacterized protein [Diabrotica undecimpunctata]|uniref:uncharacterized protein n=1 Tax=Diabrotica undecimpunctata TaxID=50387 RepID=UPI003B63D8D1
MSSKPLGLRDLPTTTGANLCDPSAIVLRIYLVKSDSKVEIAGIQYQFSFKERSKKCLRLVTYFNNSEGTNCLDEFDTILANITPEVIEKCQILIPEPNIFKYLKIESRDYTNLNISEKNGFVYVGGYFMKKMLEKHKCASCLQYGKEQTDLSDSTIYSFFKAYPNAENDTFGNLKMPNMNFITYIHALENVFCEYFPEMAINQDIGKNLKNMLSNIEPPKPCQEFPVDYLIALFVRVRIYYTIKFLNQDIRLRLRPIKVI